MPIALGSILRLPLEFIVSRHVSLECVYRKLVAESVVCDDLQITLIMFRVVTDWVIRERWNNRYPIRHLISIHLAHIPGERASKTILQLCLRRGGFKKINPQELLNIQFQVDDFGARFFLIWAEVLRNNLTYFGLTRDVIYFPQQNTGCGRNNSPIRKNNKN